ncbi:DUF262 domain-containing protein [Flavobacterium psychrophilum]|uniref:DUF262 domain-containing protein n=1 Tax=Flavobacterium psychrophilum TaxID=96345 RepID=UPI00106C6EB4|nr:DUF262 domain-containing protein [Flavobacterium psychrophilum]
MKAEEKCISEIFADNNSYEIPNYQRPYSWNQDNVSDLVNDINDAFENDLKEYFIGSIITIEKDKKTFEVVDGQQRLTTITLIFSALRNLIKNETAKSELQKKILPINALTDEPEQPRLKVRNKEEMFFYDYILLNKKLDDDYNFLEIERKFIKNVRTIETLLGEYDETYLKKYANYLLQNVYLVLVKTDSFESAYRLFNVLNARGLALSNADLLKNLLFGRCSNETEQKKVEKYWNLLEDIITLKNIDIFLSHYRTSLKGNKAQNDLFQEYDSYLKNNAISSEYFCKKLIETAKHYIKIRKNDFEENNIKKIVHSLLNVSYDEWLPTILAFMNNPVKDLEFNEFLSLIEKTTYQNWVRRLGRTKRNTVYYNLINLINKGTNKEEIVSKTLELTNNEEFFKILESNLYGMSYAKAVLLRLENSIQDDSVFKSYSGLISIEHILPQKATETYWTERFSNQQINENVHRIGNLVLLSGRKNSQAQNYNFDKKKDVYLKNSEKVSFDLTKEICEKSEWNLDNFNKRQNQMIENSRKLWEIK